jgi:hypothetical protein
MSGHWHNAIRLDGFIYFLADSSCVGGKLRISKFFCHLSQMTKLYNCHGIGGNVKGQGSGIITGAEV